MSRIIARFFLFSLIFLTPLPNIGTDIYTPSLPVIIHSLNSTALLVKWSVIIYFVMYGVGQLIFGPLSDIYGRRIFLIYALTLFAIFSGICGVTHNFYGLLVGRFFQGVVAAIVSVVSKAMITDQYHKQRLQTVSRYKVMAQTLSIIFAPLIPQNSVEKI